MGITQSQEDYLEMVSFLSGSAGENSAVRVTDLALGLGFSKPSVSAALKTLEEKNLVRHERYGSIHLTEKGRVLAEGIREKHELLTAVLRDVLGVSDVVAEKDACKIEHTLSEETFVKLQEKMRLFLAWRQRPAEERARAEGAVNG